MKLLVLLSLLALASCTTAEHAAQAPRPARHHYHQAQRHHAHERRRASPVHLF